MPREEKFKEINSKKLHRNETRFSPSSCIDEDIDMAYREFHSAVVYPDKEESIMLVRFDVSV